MDGWRERWMVCTTICTGHDRRESAFKGTNVEAATCIYLVSRIFLRFPAPWYRMRTCHVLNYGAEEKSLWPMMRTCQSSCSELRCWRKVSLAHDENLSIVVFWITVLKNGGLQRCCGGKPRTYRKYAVLWKLFKKYEWDEYVNYIHFTIVKDFLCYA